jgi:hypothetical protein
MHCNMIGEKTEDSLAAVNRYSDVLRAFRPRRQQLSVPAPAEQAYCPNAGSEER